MGNFWRLDTNYSFYKEQQLPVIVTTCVSLLYVVDEEAVDECLALRRGTGRGGMYSLPTVNLNAFSLEC